MGRSLLIAGTTILLVAGAGGAVYYHYYATAQASQGVMEPVVVGRHNLTAAVSVSGTTEAEKTVDLSFKNGGTVNTVPVQVGDTVATGTVLATLTSATLHAQLAQAEAGVSVQLARLRDLEGGTRSEQIAVTQADLAKSETALASADQGLLSALDSAQSTSDSAVRVTIDQFITNPTMANSALTIPVTDITLGQSILDERRSVTDALNTWSHRVGALQNASTSALTAASTDMHAYLGTIASMLDGLTQLLTTVNTDGYASAQAAVTTVRADIAAADTTLTTADQAIANAQAAIVVAQKQLALEQAGSRSAVVAAQRAVVRSAEAQVTELKDRLKEQTITAPWGGIVSAVNAKVGATIGAGQPAVSLISNGPLKVEGYVPEVHYAELAVGQPVFISLDAFPGVSFLGTLGKINPTATLQDNVPNFKVTVYFAGSDKRLKPGLTANAKIDTAVATDTLAVPLAAVMGSGANATVQKLVGNVATTAPVTLGIQGTNGYVQVTSGLVAGDTVLVNNTKEYRIVPN